MPFKECSIVSVREEFCRLALGPGGQVRALCRRFGISSATGYKWLGRYRLGGLEGLVDRSRRPGSSPWRSSAALEARVVAVRVEHPAWGGRKIRRVLQNQGLLEAPSASTITQILRRHGLLDGPGAGERRDWVRFEHPDPNDLWQMDFKGWFDLAGRRCHPLTVLDDHSRYALEIGACADEQGETVRARLEAVFARYGLPWRILADNGPPWGTAGHGPYSRLGVWLMDLDVGLSHGRPYHPQTQGKDERFHRTLKAEVIQPGDFKDLNQAQAAFDAWREVYNTQRPHEGIGLSTPCQRYRISPRAMPKTIQPPDYEPQAEVRRVDQNGFIAFKGRKLRCSKAFAGKRLALRATNTDGCFHLCYRRHVLAQIDLRQDTAKTAHHVSEQVLTLSPV
jgi:transposase InsO family protein